MLGRFSIFIATFALLGLTACQTNMVKAFGKIQNGWDKHQVLETVGDPNSVTRMHGKDRWIYRYYDDGVPRDQEVHFEGGLVVYSGNAWTPPPERQAAVADTKNAEREVVIQAEQKKIEEDRKNANDALADFEKTVRGEKDKVKYMPDFVELK